MSDPNEQVAAYEYDGLFRRIEKLVTNQGTGIVHGSDAGGITAIQAGNRHEHYYYTGWRLIETRDGSDDTLSQFVYGPQYIDEPLRYDRNTDVGDPNDSGCLDEGSAAYFYHQDVNYRVVMLTDEAGDVVERYRYTAYGEPAVFGGDDASGDELANALFVSSVGNPLVHQGLFRDPETRLNYSRLRMHHARLGRFMQRDPLGYLDGLNLYECLHSAPLGFIDPLGLCDPTRKARMEEFLKWLDSLLLKEWTGWSAEELLGKIILITEEQLQAIIDWLFSILERKGAVVILLEDVSPWSGAEPLAESIAQDKGATVVYVDSAELLKDTLEEGYTDATIIGHGTDLGKLDSKKAKAAFVNPWVPVDDRFPGLIVGDEAVIPADVAGWDMPYLEYVDLYACYQGYESRATEWQDAFGEDVEVKTYRGRVRPWMRWLTTWP